MLGRTSECPVHSPLGVGGGSASPSLSRLFIFPPLSPRSTFLVFGLLESQNPDLGPRPIPSWLAARARPRLQAPPLPGGHHGRSSAQPLEFTEAAASSPSPLGPEMGTEETGSSDSRHQVCPGPEPATAPGHFPGKQCPGGSVVSWPSESEHPHLEGLPATRLPPALMPVAPCTLGGCSLLLDRMPGRVPLACSAAVTTMAHSNVSLPLAPGGPSSPRETDFRPRLRRRPPPKASPLSSSSTETFERTVGGSQNGGTRHAGHRRAAHERARGTCHRAPWLPQASPSQSVLSEAALPAPRPAFPPP